LTLSFERITPWKVSCNLTSPNYRKGRLFRKIKRNTSVRPSLEKDATPAPNPRMMMMMTLSERRSLLPRNVARGWRSVRLGRQSRLPTRVLLSSTSPQARFLPKFLMLKMMRVLGMTIMFPQMVNFPKKVPLIPRRLKNLGR